MGAPTSKTAPASTSEYAFPWAPLLILASAIFVAVTSEFVPVGLLPDLAETFDVSESQVGLLVTIFAGSVVVSAAPLTALTRNVPRKKLVIAVLVVFAIGNLLAALAPTYTVLVIARVIGGVAHGLFWSIVGAYTGYLVPKHHLGRAVAITSGGGSAAFVLGVPLGTALGQALGWRLTFAVIAAVIAVILVLVLKFLPAISHRVELKTGEIAVPMRKDRSVVGVVLLCVIVLITMNAHYVFYTYISPYLTGVAGFDETSIAPLLFLFGGAGAIGLVISGFVSDKYPRAGLAVAFTVVAACVLVIAVWHSNTAIVLVAIVIWAIAFGGAPAMMQTRLLHTASPRIRDAASAWYTTAFNAAIGAGALIGGGLLDRYGLEILPYVDVALLLIGIVVLLVSNVIVRRRSLPRDVSLSTGSISTIGSP
ncbi:putative MFS family arabinose efflux permease [Glaciihabitans tibetensis]|uniref:Putative MFS family arabinose efflux permease n=1 Tax=Glaciihabitans tibetensis TaxID=1266600 RepID=A0A2T0VBW8_9MICO|nr:MFS transporter [Glaciihabitans tibetensis]PRY67651.1 putative MFS family arabinose efflux permease [Glaciihabitans tibetensis]